MENKRNILLICCDQLSYLACGYSGNTDVKTPHLDRLAGRSISLSKAITASPVCVASRAAFLTGRLPSDNGITENAQHDRPLERWPSNELTMGRHFAEAGYRCLHVGKEHTAGTLNGFDHMAVRCEGEDGNLFGVDDHGAELLDRGTVSVVRSFLKSEQDRPFFLFADLDDPHDICGWLADLSRMPSEKSPPGPLPQLLPNGDRSLREKRALPVQYHQEEHVLSGVAESWTPEDYQHYLKAYYAYVAKADHWVGQIVEALEQSPHAANTLLVFISDHGESMGALGHVSKGTTFIDPCIRVPCLLSHPGIAEDKAGDELNLPVSLVDVFPTLCEYAEIPVPELPFARSFWRACHQGGTFERSHVVCEWQEHEHHCQTGRMLIEGSVKYAHYLRGGEEIYDKDTDPFECRNLAQESDRAEQLESCRAKLRQHCEETGDVYFSLRADPSLGLRRYWRDGVQIEDFWASNSGKGVQ